ncbi:MAG: hypothetical protein M9887_11895 [Chitinophagales bacterium]|nr:hypothetical protein [Chitinophagales bacterium]
MKNILTYILLSFSFVGILSAQQKGSHSNIEKVKVAYFNEKLGLNDQQAKDFWAIYHQYEKERNSLQNLNRQSNKDFSKMSDKEIYAYINASFERKEKELAIQKKYIDEYKKVLPAQTVVKILRIDEQFRRYLFKVLKEKK